jgi:hypothetical protein
MRRTIATGEWKEGTTTLGVVDPNKVGGADRYGRPADGYASTSVGYEFDSTYDQSVDEPDPTPVVFYPKEIRSIIAEARDRLPRDPFGPADFDPIPKWAEEDGDLLGEVGDSSTWCKQLKVKYNDSDTPYLKVQRGAGNSWLHGSPTMGRREFEELFGDVTLL